MTTYTTARYYSLFGSAADGWSIDYGAEFPFTIEDSTDDGQISGSVTVREEGWDHSGTYSGYFGDGLVVFINNHPYLFTNDGPYPVGFTFQSMSEPFVVCFAAGTEIATPAGTVLVESLQSGDLVLTKDRGPQPIRWVGSHKLGSAALFMAPHLRPIRIRAGALGNGCPERDLVVSPQHRILVRSRLAEKLFGEREVLVAAKQLLAIDGVEVAEDMEEVTYYHFLFDRHEIVTANGAESESLYTGPMALESVTAASRSEILEIFPDLLDVDYRAQAARFMPKGREARNMAARHVRRGEPLVN